MLKKEANIKTFRRLQVSLTHRKTPAVYLIVCDNEKTRHTIESLVRSTFTKFNHFNLSLQSQKVFSLRNAFATLLTDEVLKSSLLEYIVHVTGLSSNLFESTDKGLKATPLISELNFERDRLFHDYPFITIIWEHSFFLKKLFFEAGDLMSWMVERYEFEQEDEVQTALLQNLEKQIPSKGVLPERKRRIEELKDLLELMNIGDDNQEVVLRQQINTLKQLGKEYREALDLKHSVECFERAIQLTQKIWPGSEMEAELLYESALNYYHLREFEKVFSSITKAFRTCEEKTNNTALPGAFYHLQGMAFAEQRNWPEALMHYQKALEWKEKAGNEFELGVTYHQIGMVSGEQRNWPEALSNYQIALKSNEKAGNEFELGATYHQMGSVYFEQRNWPEALSNYQKALEWEEKTGNEFEMGGTYHQMGRVYEEQRNWPEALTNYQIALKSNEKAGNDFELGATYHQMGSVYAEQRNWPEALMNYQKALEWNEKTGNEFAMGSTYHQMGRVYAEQRNWPEALTNYQIALKSNEKAGNEFELGATYHQMGSVYAEQRNWPEALSNYQIALEWKEKTGNEFQLGRTYHQMGMVYAKQHNWQEALSYYQKALEWNEKTGNEFAMGGTYHQIGRVYEEMSDKANAIPYFELALKNLTFFNHPDKKIAANSLQRITADTGLGSTKRT